jgi:hypothetical protein
MSRVNNSHSCIVCARRTDGLAVGWWTKTRMHLGWYCKQCGPSNARSALSMKNMDDVEQRACLKVAEQIEGDVTIPAAELPAFIAWCVKSFAENMREDIENGGAPF